ncbi:20278_t:CDS:2 [Gigaspora margarita]|uniref:20278_t:CDS:1 n=1 Tax=Gigaspora margarita TaxID=4874 RepID=A0ABN7V5Q1_GIGMA|nr:20278_t:CDS:2 [Gigaspora margarita]
MPEYLRGSVFNNIANIEFEFDDKVGYNLLFFYNALDKGEFAGHESEWVMVHKQRVLEYGQRYDDDKLNYILETMPGAIQVPVDQTQLPCNPPAKMVVVQRTDNGNKYKVRVRVKRPGEDSIVLFMYDFYDINDNNKKYTCVIDTGAPQTILPFYVKRMLGRRGWSTLEARAKGYGANARQICVCQMFEISIGDNDSWTKWVQAKIVLWEENPGNQVEYALIDALSLLEYWCFI